MLIVKRSSRKQSVSFVVIRIQTVNDRPPLALRHNNVRYQTCFSDVFSIEPSDLKAIGSDRPVQPPRRAYCITTRVENPLRNVRHVSYVRSEKQRLSHANVIYSYVYACNAIVETVASIRFLFVIRSTGIMVR